MNKRNQWLALVALSMMAVLVTSCDNGSKPAIDEMSVSPTSDAMQSARQAFWQRDLKGAEQKYGELVESENASADAWGELGNVYYMQGKWPEAANAYTEAALRLVENNNLRQAMHLHQLVMRMDSEQAMRIDEKLRAEHEQSATE